MDEINSLKTQAMNIIYSESEEKAAELVATLMSAQPKDTWVLCCKGMFEGRYGRVEEAIAAYTEALEQDPNYVHALVNRAMLRKSEGWLDEAIADFESSRKLLPAQTTLGTALIRLYQETGQRDKAKGVCKELLGFYPELHYVADSLASLHLADEEWDELAELLAASQKRFATRPEYHMHEARMWRARGQPEEALAAWRAAMAAAPKSARIVSLVLNEVIDAGEYEEGIALSKEYAKSEDFAVWLKAPRARAMALLGRTDEADELFRQAFEGDKYDRSLPYHIWQVHHTYGPLVTAEKLTGWEDLVKRKWELHLEIGAAYRHGRLFDKAQETLQQALKETSANFALARVYNVMAQTHYDAGKYEECEKAYLKVLSIAPKDSMQENLARNNLAYLYAENLDEPEKGVPHARRALEVTPDAPHVLDTYGWVKAKLGRYDEAAGLLRRAAGGEPVSGGRYLRARADLETSPLARYHLGWVYEQLEKRDEALGQYRQAQAEFEEGLELLADPSEDPFYKQVSQAIERLAE